MHEIAWNTLEICLRYPWGMPEIPMKYAWDTHAICLKSCWEMSEISMICAWNMGVDPLTRVPLTRGFLTRGFLTRGFLWPEGLFDQRFHWPEIFLTRVTFHQRYPMHYIWPEDKKDAFDLTPVLCLAIFPPSKLGRCVGGTFILTSTTTYLKAFTPILCLAIF